jgi:hypothetical protein
MLRERMLVVLVGGAFGGFVAWDALNALRLARVARRWPTAPGVMTDLDLRPGRRLRSGSRLWNVSVAYDYVVDGRR